MPRFAANLTMLYGELPFLERFAAAARDGFQAVEFMFPYEHDLEAIADRLREHRLALVMHNVPAGDWAGGERGIACLPDRVDEFRAGVCLAVDVASRLGAPRLNVLAGIRPDGVTEGDARRTLVENLRFAAAQARERGIRLLLEPVNTFDIPGFFVARTRDALALIDQVGADNLSLQYDLYHAQRMEGELAATLRAHLHRIAHVQLADNPGRNEPGTGEINYRFLFGLLDELGYAGYVGCEYKPRAAGPGGTSAGLGWAAAHGQALSISASRSQAFAQG
ncbi:MAG TPA: hydroxypyruvate isomerase [Ramlibacter sp.]|nr:hydroxypyruvate isomerase [Ramlibacter sp.]